MHETPSVYTERSTRCTWRPWRSSARRSASSSSSPRSTENSFLLSRRSRRGKAGVSKSALVLYEKFLSYLSEWTINLTLLIQWIGQPHVWRYGPQCPMHRGGDHKINYKQYSCSSFQLWFIDISCDIRVEDWITDEIAVSERERVRVASPRINYASWWNTKGAGRREEEDKF